MVSMEPYVEEALTRMYEEAEPPLDFQEVLDDPQLMDGDWYEQHYLSGERQQQIVSDISEEYNLDSLEETNLSMEAILNYGPTANPHLVETVDAPSDQQ